MSRSAFVLLFITAVLSAFSFDEAQAYLIDDFTDSSYNFVDPGLGGFKNDSSTTLDAAPLGSIVGGVRLSEIFNSSDDGAMVLETKTGTSISSEVLSVSSEPGVTGFIHLGYTGSSAGLGGGLGVDLTDGGSSNAFNIAINVADFPGEVTIFIEYNNRGLDSVTYPLPGLIPAGAPVSVPIPFASFAP